MRTIMAPVHTWVVAAIAARLCAGCVFDQTDLPPLPDEVLHFGQQPDGGGGGGGDPIDCKRDVPQLDDFGTSEGMLSGTWARRLILKTERDTRNSGVWNDSSWTVTELVKVWHQGTRVREVVEVCDIEMVVIDGAVTDFPRALLDTLPVLAEEGDFLSTGAASKTIGAAYQSPAPLVRLYGLDPAAATKPWGRCDSYFDPNNLAEECPMALWPEIVDVDCDGFVGATIDVTVGTTPTGQVYMVQRDEMTRSGTVETADRIAGALEVVEDYANLGSSKAMLKSNPPSRVVDGSTFTMVKLADEATCDQVKGAAFDE